MKSIEIKASAESYSVSISKPSSELALLQEILQAARSQDRV
jgi:hypothetical protein